MPEPIRIEKYLSEAGLASRREAQALIKAGLVFINGKAMRATGLKIDPIKDKVELHSEAKKMSDRRETVAIYKPRGVVSSKDTDEGVKTVFDIFPQYKHLNTVGRLDKESEGLLLLSNDGLITKAITGKDHLIEKEYVVTVREDVLPVHMKKMSEGMKLADGMTLPATATKIDKHTFSISLREGRKHQIRRMSDACKLTVMSLKRIRIGSITLRSMRAGQARVLTEKDINQLKNILHEGF